MALSAQDVITVQPAAVELVQPAAGQLQYDANGEPIIFEGICRSNAIKASVKSYYFIAGLRIGVGLGLMCCWPLGIYLGKRACETWRLYLTDKHIHYSTTVMSPSSPSATLRKIALTDVQGIQAATSLVKVGFCNMGTKLSMPTTIQIEQEVSSCGCCCKLPIVFQLRYCDNAVDFVEAVKRQMNVICRE